MEDARRAAARLPPWLALASTLVSCAALPAHHLALQQDRHEALRNGPSHRLQGGAAAENREACARFEQAGLYRQAEADFARYAGGLSDEQQAAYTGWCGRAVNNSCLSVLIRDGRLYVRRDRRGPQTRLRSTLHALYRVSQRFWPLPDAELTIDISDGWTDADLPIFVISRRRADRARILYPDFTFFAWPESVCPPETSHAYGHLYGLYAEQAQREELDAEAAWAAKQDSLFWRGGGTGNRSDLVSSLSGVPGMDVRTVEWHGNSITGNNNVSGCTGLLDTCQYRYLGYLEGWTYSSSLKYKLLCGSCLFTGPIQWVEWWSGLLEPGTDFVPVRADWSDAAEQLQRVRALPDGGRGMALRSRRKVLDILSEDAVDCYWLRLIEHGSRLFPTRASALQGNSTMLRPIEDVLLYPRGAAGMRRPAHAK